MAIGVRAIVAFAGVFRHNFATSESINVAFK